MAPSSLKDPICLLVMPEVVKYQDVDSTNVIAFARAEAGARHGAVVQALAQTCGRGRMTRSFSSPPGGLYISVILRPTIALEEFPLITLAAGVAGAEAIEKITGVSIGLKWPNDLFCNNLKLGGILTEAAPFCKDTSSIPFVVVGIGINVNTPIESFPESLQAKVTSLQEQTLKQTDLDQLLLTLHAKLLAEIQLLEKNRQQVLTHWQQRDILLGKELQWVDLQGQVVRGIGKGLLDDGRYRLTTSSGDDYPVLAGDIVLTEINGQNIRSE